jgi:hypothetical protein
MDETGGFNVVSIQGAIHGETLTSPDISRIVVAAGD